MAKKLLFISIFFVLWAFFPYASAQDITLSDEQVFKIGERIFQNECSDQNKCLLTWNEGEDFLSLGVGHFIWYPAATSGPFEESFIKLLNYLESKGNTPPGWLTQNPKPPCPWNSRQDFLKDPQDPRILDLQDLLVRTKSDQYSFLLTRLNEALPTLIQFAKDQDRPKISKQFYLLSSTPSGIYALMDYINFKGLGVLPSERYQNQGWGLLQILSEMTMQEDSAKALEEFAQIAGRLLEERVKNSPAQRNEEKWLPGWKKRVNSYLQAF
ncbi:MAG: hypothetical protein WC676_03525 [Candidatus Omnitrophota bacterium]